MPLDINPDVRAAWCAALRSGEYTQGRGSLRDEQGGYCCLGVLTDLAVKAGVVEWADRLASQLDLPAKVSEWAGLTSSDPELGTGDDAEPAASRNDAGDSWMEIADLIDGGVTP